MEISIFKNGINLKQSDRMNNVCTTNIYFIDLLLHSISKTWSKEAIQFIREMVAASKSTHFEPRVNDKFGNEYGELYLILDGEIVTMSKALVYNRFATAVSSRKAGRVNSKCGTESHNDKHSLEECKTISDTSDDSGRWVDLLSMKTILQT